MTSTYTLVSARVGDLPPGVELAELEATDGGGIISLSDLARLTALPQVRDFFAANQYDADHPDEVMHLVTGEYESGPFDTLTVTLPGIKAINLTPHPVTIAGVTIPPAGPAPRCATTTRPTAPVRIGGQEIPVEIVSLGKVSDLPEPANDTIYIVSRIIAESAPHRRDLYIPHRLERDTEGRVIGCAVLGQVPPGSEPTQDAVTVRLVAGELFKLAGAACAELRTLIDERSAQLASRQPGEYADNEVADIRINYLHTALVGLSSQVAAQLDRPEDYPPGYDNPQTWENLRATVNALVSGLDSLR